MTNNDDDRRRARRARIPRRMLEDLGLPAEGGTLGLEDEDGHQKENEDGQEAPEGAPNADTATEQTNTDTDTDEQQQKTKRSLEDLPAHKRPGIIRSGSVDINKRALRRLEQEIETRKIREARRRARRKRRGS